MIPTVAVHGTWGLDGAWWRPRSAWAMEAEKHGLRPAQNHVVLADGTLRWVDVPDPAAVFWPFKWTGELGGLRVVPYPPDPDEQFNDRALSPWLLAGYHLYTYCMALGFPKVHLYTHSHGLQVGAFAAAFGLRVGTFLSVSGPIRRDMQRVRRKARPNIDTWVQTYDDVHDSTIREGELADGHIGFVYTIPEADANLPAVGFGHSGLFETAHLSALEALGIWAQFPPQS